MSKLSKWVIGLAVFSILFLWFNDIIEREELEKAEAYELWVQGNHNETGGDYVRAIDYYKAAFDIVEGDTIASRIVACMRKLGNTAGALEWMDVYERVDRKSDLTAVRRAAIYLDANDPDRARSILDSVISTPVKLQTLGFGRTVLDSWLYKNAEYTEALNHYSYFVDYFAKLLALESRIQLARSADECYQLGGKLFCLAEDMEDDYALIHRYLEIKRGEAKPYNMRYGSLALELDDILTHVENNVINSYAGPLVILNTVSRMKWDLFNRIVVKKHFYEGYQAAVDYANLITANNTRNADAYANYHKYLYGIYLGVGGDSRFQTELTIEELNDIMHKSVDENGETPLMLINVGREFDTKGSNDKQNTVFGDRIIAPIVVMGCNDWTCRDASTNFIGGYILQNRGRRKTLRYIDDSYEARTTYTYQITFNLIFSSEPSSLMYVNLLEAEYAKRMAQ